MNMSGSGTGFLDYQINDERPITNASCNVKGSEDDDAQALVLDLYFADSTHGFLIVEITVGGFSPARSQYSTAQHDRLTVIVDLGKAGCFWATEDVSSASLNVTVTEASSSCHYSGFLSAANLQWRGAGSQPALAVKFESFSLTMNEEEEP